MFGKRTIFGYLVGLGFLLGINSGQIELMSNAETEVQKHNLATTCFSAAIAQNIAAKITGGAVAQMLMEMPASSEVETTQFRRIEQPLGLKLAVTTGGIALIGLELWWFLWSKTTSQQSQTNQGIQ